MDSFRELSAVPAMSANGTAPAALSLASAPVRKRSRGCRMTGRMSVCEKWESEYHVCVLRAPDGRRGRGGVSSERGKGSGSIVRVRWEWGAEM